MPLIAVLVGVAAGFAVWGVLDQIQSRQVGKIFGEELEIQLDLQARESLIRFDRYLASYGMATRLLANHRRLTRHLEAQPWPDDDKSPPVLHRGSRPSWLPDFFESDELRPPSLAILTDRRRRVREIYRGGSDPVPADLSFEIPTEYLGSLEAMSVPVRRDDGLYLLASAPIVDADGRPTGYLVVLTPIDDAFLAESQRGVDPSRAAVALVDGADGRILASTDSADLPPGTELDRWRDAYLIVSRPLSEDDGSDSNLLLATFATPTKAERMSRHVRIFEQRQRALAALVFVGVFTGVIYLVSARLNRILKRMTRFSQRALGIPEPGFQREGNQLLLLEDWIAHFTQLVLKAREEMDRRHRAEMKESEALKAAMMEASLDSVVTLDHEGRIIEANPAVLRVFGWGRDALLGERFAERFLPEVARGAFRRLLARSRHEGLAPQGRGELVARKADGGEIPVEISIVPIDLESERFYTLYIHDVTARKRAEREIKSLARFASESPNPILRVNPDGAIVYANKSSRPLLAGWGAESSGRLPPDWCPEVLEALAAGEPREREIEIEGFVYSLLFAPIRDLGYVNIYARDITEVRRAEKESRQHQADLVHVSRLSTMGEVATGMAHELNQPLSAIVNYANGCIRRIQSGAGQTGDLLGALAQIASQAQRASEIIRRLRALVGKQPPSRAEADLSQLVREVCSFVELETARVGAQIELELAPVPVVARVDLVQIEQVLLNLVHNALDALEEAPPHARRLAIRTQIRGDEALVCIADSGPGVEPERLQHVFDPFFTTKETGMGMGLPISRTIVENHEGRIWAESEPGHGTAFWVALPLASSAPGVHR